MGAARMDDWFEKYAEALEKRLDSSEASLHLPGHLKNPILTLARIVAHGTERKNTPLATYVAGRYVVARDAQGVDEATAVAEALRSPKPSPPPESLRHDVRRAARNGQTPEEQDPRPCPRRTRG